jgi:chromosome partitioning protein
MAKGSTARTRVIFVGNHKGGVGKTTNCIHLAAALGAAGRRTLVWDLDANQGATLHLGIDGDRYLGSREVLEGRESPLDVVVTQRDVGVTLPPGVDLLPAGRNLEGTHNLSSDALAAPLAQLEGRYDYIFFDTAPNLTGPTRAAYRAATWFVFSAVPDPFSIVGLRSSIEHLRAAVESGNTGARLLGVLFARVRGGRLPRTWIDQRSNLDQQLIQYAETHLKDHLGASLRFSTTIGTTVEIPRCQMQGRTLFQTRPRHRVTGQYRKLATELENRINQLENRLKTYST